MDDLWASTEGAPTLVITHDSDVVVRCDRVVRLDNGTSASTREIALRETKAGVKLVVLRDPEPDNDGG